MKRINVNDIVGKKFNRLTVLSFSHKKLHPNPSKGYFYFYKCQCECGNITVVRRERLISLETKSCGCYGKEVRNKILATKRTLSHRLYRIWRGIKHVVTMLIVQDTQIMAKEVLQCVMNGEATLMLFMSGLFQTVIKII